MTYVVDLAHPHLGGYHEGGDPLSWYPDLWRHLVQVEGVRSVLDVGCGEGQALGFFRKLGCRVVGVDGIPQGDPDIHEHDYTLGPADHLGDFDLCWSCEFVEHVEERFMGNYLATFRCARLVLMSHAVPGQGGYHHVNCRTDEYWLGVMAAIGFDHDHELTLLTRRLASNGYYAWSGLAFQKRPIE